MAGENAGNIVYFSSVSQFNQFIQQQYQVQSCCIVLVDANTWKPFADADDSLAAVSVPNGQYLNRSCTDWR